MSHAIAERAMAADRDNPFHRLIKSFEKERISYSCFRSAVRAPAAMTGQSDLDLLIARVDRDRATAILRLCGFRHWPDATPCQSPAIESYLAYDERSGAIFHAHVHFRLLIGPPLCKTHHIPIEDGLLHRSRFRPGIGVRMLDPIDEALLLSLRECLERAWTDPVALKRWKTDTDKRRSEIAAVAAAVDRDSLRRRAADFFDETLSAEIAEWFFEDAASQPAFSRRRRKMKRALASYRIANAPETAIRGSVASSAFLFGQINRRFFNLPRATRRRAPGGGVVVALVGVDGSGKSTQCAQLRTWLGAEVDVMACYFGTGDGRPSLLLAPFKLAAPLIGRMIRTKPKGASHGKISDRPPGPIYSLLFSIWAAAVALDKRRKLALIRRAILRGMVVVTDRYPQNENEEFNDGPLLHRVPSAPQWLKRFEARVYETAKRNPPDLVIKLHVDDHVVARREPDMDKGVIAARICRLRDLTFSGTRIVSIDAHAPLADVTRAVRNAVWAIL